MGDVIERVPSPSEGVGSPEEMAEAESLRMTMLAIIFWMRRIGILSDYRE